MLKGATPLAMSTSYVNGFTESGDYRIVLYAQDRLGIHATPKLAGDAPGGTLYLPLINR